MWLSGEVDLYSLTGLRFEPSKLKNFNIKFWIINRYQLPIKYRPGNSGHDTMTQHEHDTNTNLTRHEKIIKTRQKTRHGQKNEHDTET